MNKNAEIRMASRVGKMLDVGDVVNPAHDWQLFRVITHVHPDDVGLLYLMPVVQITQEFALLYALKGHESEMLNGAITVTVPEYDNLLLLPQEGNWVKENKLDRWDYLPDAAEAGRKIIAEWITPP